MSNLPISSKYVSTPDVAVDAREREAIVARVNAAFEDGQLDDFDYRACLDRAFAAKTLGELRPVVEKLPVAATYATPANIEQARVQPGELTPATAPSNRSMLVLGGGIVVAVLLLVLVLGLVF